MLFKVPQNVQREDTIIGPLTMRHLIICAVGGGIAYAIYVTLSRDYLWPVWLPPVAFFVLLTLAFAFLKIHELTFFRYLLFLIEYLVKPKRLFYVQGAAEVRRSLLMPPPQKKEESIERELKKAEQLEAILKKVGAPKPPAV